MSDPKTVIHLLGNKGRWRWSIAGSNPCNSCPNLEGSVRSSLDNELKNLFSFGQTDTSINRGKSISYRGRCPGFRFLCSFRLCLCPRSCLVLASLSFVFFSLWLFDFETRLGPLSRSAPSPSPELLSPENGKNVSFDKRGEFRKRKAKNIS